MRMFSNTRAHPIEEPQINLTALIDVVFVMLIMFILIAPLLELERIELADAPQMKNDKSLSVQEASMLSVHVQKDNTVWINKENVSVDKLVEKLKTIKKLFPQAKPQLFHDRTAHFGTYQAVKNALEEAGYSEVDVVLKPA